MGKIQEIKEKILYQTNDVKESYDITPWKVTKAVAGLVGASMSSFVVGTILRNQMPAQPKTTNVVKAAVGIYLMEGLVSKAVNNYVNESLSEFDVIFDPDVESVL